ncbi:MAG: ComEC/Rec2 family competence protein, partial [Cyanobacteria bacterium J06600_6]
MTRRSWIAIALAYVVGLWLTNWIGYHLNDWNHEYLWLLLLILFGLVISTVRFLRHKLRNAIAIVLVTVIAVVYLQLRTPQPLYNDVGYQVSQGDRQLVTLTGKVLTEPRLSDRQTLKFVLQTRFKVNENNQEKVSGKLYSSLPLLQGTGIYPGQELSLTGYLYLPQSIKNDYGFDFQQYLARQGIFAGMQGVEASFEPRIQNWSWSRLRQRIVRVHLQGLGSPKGQLVSSMVLGRKAVDLPPDIRDRFIVSGLAHVLAASGFHVSLLLGIVLQLTARIGAKSRLGIGLATLSIYLGLTGIQASVLRACLMGGATLLALTMETKVKPLGSLLLAAVLILLFDPLLIDDLGFKLSFLATFGLIVTLPPLQSKLDWLPPTIATLSAIPLAATIWVLPLLCYEFNTVATYSLAANMICTPLIILVSLGGMISAIAGLILPAFGSAIASLLFYPVSLLMAITQFCSTLPGNNWSVGQIPVGILLTIYGLLILIWQRRWWQKRWWLGLVLPMILIISITLYNSTLVQVSVLATRNLPIVVIRDRGQVVLINSGSDRQAKYTVLPFLAQQGINQIDYGIAINSGFQASTAWKMINSRARISSIYKTMVDGSLSNLPT